MENKSSEETKLEESESELDKEFKVANAEFNKEFEPLYGTLCEALDKITKLSDKYGIPVSLGISPLSNTYTPSTFLNKFKEVNNEIVEDLTNCYDFEYSGWYHSAVC